MYDYWHDQPDCVDRKTKKLRKSVLNVQCFTCRSILKLSFYVIVTYIIEVEPVPITGIPRYFPNIT